MKNLIGALVKFQSEVSGAEKNSTNPHFKNAYANLEGVIEASREALTRNGLALMQAGRVVNGQAMLVTTLMHVSGESMESVLPILNERNTAQGMGSGISYVRRYAQLALLNLAQVDDDGEEASSRNDPPQRPQPTPLKAAPRPAKAAPPEPKPKPKVRSDAPADYVVNFGKKLMGKRLGDIDTAELIGMMDWLNNEAKKPLTTAAKEFLQKAEAYIETQIKEEGE